MRRVTRNFVIGLLAVVVLLLALGALPGYLKSGDPYYMTATEVNDTRPAINASDLPEQRFPYATAALDSGRSDPYWKGPFGIKGAFTHSPFDEVDAIGQRQANATADGAVYVTEDGTLYRLTITQDS